jgi:NAD(P)-dependent dehydrogenase (short-subunit alcohol dehydrogenase family)
MGRLDNMVLVVTGGSSGIGKATAIRCALEGAKVAVCDVQDAAGKETVESIVKEGFTAKYYHMDVTSEKEIEKTFKKIASELGLITGLVNNAGIADPKNDTKPLHEGKLEVWERILQVNLVGVLLCTKHAIPYMIQAGKGTIVNVASVAAIVGLSNIGYTASKGAVYSLTRNMAVNYAQHNIRVNSVTPGFIDTPMLRTIQKEISAKSEERVKAIPLNRLGTPDEVASAIAFLLSDDASYVTGANIAIDGGFTAK